MVYRDKEYRKCTCAREIDIAPIKQDDERGEHCSRDYQTCGYSNYADIFFRRYTFIPTAAGENAVVTGDRTSRCGSPRRDSGVAAFEDADDACGCIATDLGAKAAVVGWDRGLRDASDKGEAENDPR